MDSLTPLGVAGGVPYILVVLISLWARGRQLPLYAAVVGSILIVVGYFSSPAGGELWKVIANRALALFALWVVAIFSVQRRRLYEERELARQEIKILKGLLPICAACKNIRDDKGYWKQMESYIREHSEAEFSHGICPECIKKLYPELDLPNDENTNK